MPMWMISAEEAVTVAREGEGHSHNTFTLFIMHLHGGKLMLQRIESPLLIGDG
jgi:hypothetical protein